MENKPTHIQNNRQPRTEFIPRENRSKRYDIGKLVPDGAQILTFGGGSVTYSLDGKVKVDNLRELIAIRGDQAVVSDANEVVVPVQPNEARPVSQQVEEKRMAPKPSQPANSSPSDSMASLTLKSLRRDQRWGDS